MAREERNSTVYNVPANFAESGRIINGMFKTRNFIEAVIWAVIAFFFLNMIPYPSTSSKIMWMIIGIGPVAMLCIVGIDDESLFQFVQAMFKWRKNRAVMLYDRSAKTRKMRAVDALMGRELPREKLQKMLNDWKERRAENFENIDLVEGENFYFAKDRDTQWINDMAREQREKEEKEKAEYAVDEIDFTDVDLDDCLIIGSTETLPSNDPFGEV